MNHIKVSYFSPGGDHRNDFLVNSGGLSKSISVGNQSFEIGGRWERIPKFVDLAGLRDAAGRAACGTPPPPSGKVLYQVS